MPRRYGIRFDEPDPVPPPDEVASWFAAAPGLYLHIPFCRTLCPFCPYNKVRYRSDAAARYVRHLEREAASYLSVLSGPFPSLYVGGGTPTLCLDEIGELLQRLPITGERAVEVLPGHMSEEGARRLVDLGFDFVSLGVQSFDPRVLRRLKRPGSPGINRAAVETALGRFRCVDVDLIFDSAFDDPQILLDDLAVCFGYEVDQVSTYPLMRFGYTPFGKERHDRRREHAVLRDATELAHAHGYERRAVWTFNRAGSPAYTSITRPYYLGMGAGAASFAGRRFFVNHFGLEQYGSDVDAGELPIAVLALLPLPAAAVYRTFWQAYTGAIPVDTADPLLQQPVSKSICLLSRALGWSRRTNDAIVLTETGYDFYHDLERWVTYQLIEPLWEELMQEHERTPIAVTRGVS